MREGRYLFRDLELSDLGRNVLLQFLLGDVDVWFEDDGGMDFLAVHFVWDCERDCFCDALVGENYPIDFHGRNLFPTTHYHQSQKPHERGGGYPRLINSFIRPVIKTYPSSSSRP